MFLNEKLLIIPEGKKFANFNIELGLSFTTLQPIKYLNIPKLGENNHLKQTTKNIFDTKSFFLLLVYILPHHKSYVMNHDRVLVRNWRQSFVTLLIDSR